MNFYNHSQRYLIAAIGLLGGLAILVGFKTRWIVSKSRWGLRLRSSG